MQNCVNRRLLSTIDTVVLRRNFTWWLYNRISQDKLCGRVLFTNWTFSSLL